MMVIDIDKCAHMTSSHLECKNCLAFESKRKPPFIRKSFRENTMHQLGWGLIPAISEVGLHVQEKHGKSRKLGGGAHKDAFIFSTPFSGIA